MKPLKVLEMEGQLDVFVNVSGGGIKGQTEAIRLGIARALVEENPDNKPALRKERLMTRDARVVERKKTGLRKARKQEQFSKR
jgi:small subunit ribosomal protein S9